MTAPDSEPVPPRKRAARKKPGPEISVEKSTLAHGLRIESAESPEELRSRLSIEEARASHELWRDRAILRVCLFGFPLLAFVCLLILLLPGGSVETRTWATSTLTGIATGIVGYSLGKSGKGS